MENSEKSFPKAGISEGLAGCEAREMGRQRSYGLPSGSSPSGSNKGV